MKLELWKRYLTRNNQVVIITKYFDCCDTYSYYGTNESNGKEAYYTEDGKFFDDKESKDDIIAEYNDNTDSIVLCSRVLNYNDLCDFLVSNEFYNTLSKDSGKFELLLTWKPE